MTIDILYALTLLVFLPALVIQTRVLLYKSLHRAVDDRRQTLEIMLDELPHDLAIIGMTLGFAAFALARPRGTQPSTTTIFAIAPLLPFLLMSAMPILRSKHLRLAVGLLAYLSGVVTFLTAQHVGLR